MIRLSNEWLKFNRVGTHGVLAARLTVEWGIDEVELQIG